jgi:hypothetical protein
MTGENSIKYYMGSIYTTHMSGMDVGTLMHLMYVVLVTSVVYSNSNYGRGPHYAAAAIL